MDKLPPEILHIIFIQLNLKQRLECLRVCRSWWSALDRHSLFYSVEIARESIQFDRVIKTFKQSPELATRVEVLDIGISPFSFFNKSTLFTIFPNTRIMTLRQVTDSSPTFDFGLEEPILLTHLGSKVEHLSDFLQCNLFTPMLSSNLGGRLKTLDLELQNKYHLTTRISQAKNLPVLRQLTLRHLYTKLDDLENLHENIPSVQDFSIKGLSLTSSDVPSSIVPALSISKFKFNYSSSRNAMLHARFYQYAAIKYANATDINYEYKMIPYRIASDVKHVYLNGFLDFLKLIAPHKRELYFHRLPNDVNPFEVLDAVHAHIKNFYFRDCESGTLFKYLSRSKQSSCIEQFNLQDTIVDSYHFFKDMVALTTLSIEYFNRRLPPRHLPPLHLVDCLASCPDTLKTLTLHCPNLVVKSSTVILNSIESLNIGCKILTSELGDIISHCFPNMVSLSLTGQVKENVNITLQSPHFKEVTISIITSRIHSYRACGLSFKSSNQTENQYCHYDGKMEKCVQSAGIQHLPTLSFVSFTKKRLVLGNGINVVSC